MSPINDIASPNVEYTVPMSSLALLSKNMSITASSMPVVSLLVAKTSSPSLSLVVFGQAMRFLLSACRVMCFPNHSVQLNTTGQQWRFHWVQKLKLN